MKHMYIRCDVSGGLVVAASSLTIASGGGSETYHAGHGGVEGIAERDSVLCIRQVIFGGIPVQPRIIRVVEDYGTRQVVLRARYRASPVNDCSYGRRLRL